MNNIERFKNGDKRLQIVVNGMDYEQKTLVQEGFSKLGWRFNLGVGYHLTCDDVGYTNEYSTSTGTSGHNLYRQTITTNDDYPITTFTELMILADMYTQEDVIPYLNEDELIKYGVKQEESMGNNNEFTKDMLKDGMFVLMRDQENKYSKGYCIILNGKLISEDGFIYLKSYSEDLTRLDSRNHFDIVEVFTSEKLTILSSKYYQEELTSIWKRPSPEEVQRLSEKAALQEDIHAMKERLKSMESKLESM